MASLSSSLLSSSSSSNLLLHSTNNKNNNSTKPHLSIIHFKATNPSKTKLKFSNFATSTRQQQQLKRRLFVLSATEETTSSTAVLDPPSEAARRVYIGNIPRTLTNEELTKIVAEHGAVEKTEVMYDKYSGRSRRFAFVTMKTVDDANAAIEKLNGTEIGGREIKANITEKPLTSAAPSFVQPEDTPFIDSPYKVYVGNLAKMVTTETLKSFFSEKGKVISAKVSRVPGTSKSSGFGFVTFSSEQEVDAAISSFNNSMFDYLHLLIAAIGRATNSGEQGVMLLALNSATSSIQMDRKDNSMLEGYCVVFKWDLIQVLGLRILYLSVLVHDLF
ncbi:hypothetical protein ACFE04_003541 [Oxalis oulophora]